MQQPYVVARELSKAFDGKRVLDDVSFAVEPGDVIGVLGKNGAGKTTLLELVLGFTPASGGHVEVFGHESYKLPGTAKTRVGFVPQQDELINQLSAADQLKLVRSFYSTWDDALVERLVTTWGIDLRARIKNMSVGERQKLSIVLALGHRPDLLILDEPVASLDPLARRHFLEQIVEIAADGGRSVVFSSHIVSDIERLANRIWILKNGRLHWRGAFDELKDSVVRLHLRASGRPLRDVANSEHIVGRARRQLLDGRRPRVDGRARRADCGADRRSARGRRVDARRHLSRDAPMSSIARLIWIYFTANPLCRGLSAFGLVLMLAGMTGYLTYPAWTLGTGMRRLPEWYQATVLISPWLGLILLFFASSTLPAVVERLVLGRAVYVLAGSRLCVCSACLRRRTAFHR